MLLILVDAGVSDSCLGVDKDFEEDENPLLLPADRCPGVTVEGTIDTDEGVDC